MSAHAPAPVLRIEAERALIEERIIDDAALLVSGDGTILAAGERAGVPAAAAVERRRYRGLMLPGAVNVHSHAFQILLRGRADAAVDFRDWVDHYMYRLALAIDREEIALGSRLAFAEMIRNGVTTVGEFFYLHNAPLRDGCRPLGNANADIVIEAARACGLRIQLLRCLYDRNERHGQQRFFEPAEEAIAATHELRRRWQHDPAVSVAVAPHSLHGATPEGIRAAAEAAVELGHPLQIHIAEERDDVAFARERYGDTPGRVLERLGVLDENLCVVHGCWLDAEEIGALGRAGARCAYNPISNMALGDGVTDVEQMVRAGVIVGLGCDGPCANHQVNVWQEMRFAEWLQRVTRERMNVLTPAAADARTVNYAFEMGTRNGGRVLGLPVGRLAPGYQADYVVVDTNDLSLLPHQGGEPAALLHNVVHAMAVRGALRTVAVAGRELLRDGRLLLVNEQELAREAARWRMPAE